MFHIFEFSNVKIKTNSPDNIILYYSPKSGNKQNSSFFLIIDEIVF